MQPVPEGLHFLFPAGTFPAYFSLDLNIMSEWSQQLMSLQNKSDFNSWNKEMTSKEYKLNAEWVAFNNDIA